MFVKRKFDQQSKCNPWPQLDTVTRERETERERERSEQGDGKE
jgi:hypothetical protein